MGGFGLQFPRTFGIPSGSAQMNPGTLSNNYNRAWTGQSSTPGQGGYRSPAGGANPGPSSPANPGTGPDSGGDSTTRPANPYSSGIVRPGSPANPGYETQQPQQNNPTLGLPHNWGGGGFIPDSSVGIQQIQGPTQNNPALGLPVGRFQGQPQSQLVNQGTMGMPQYQQQPSYYSSPQQQYGGYPQPFQMGQPNSYGQPQYGGYSPYQQQQQYPGFYGMPQQQYGFQQQPNGNFGAYPNFGMQGQFGQRPPMGFGGGYGGGYGGYGGWNQQRGMGQPLSPQLQAVQQQFGGAPIQAGNQGPNTNTPAQQNSSLAAMGGMQGADPNVVAPGMITSGPKPPGVPENATQWMMETDAYGKPTGQYRYNFNPVSGQQPQQNYGGDSGKLAGNATEQGPNAGPSGTKEAPDKTGKPVEKRVTS